MADIGYRNDIALIKHRKPNWSAIWAGTFSFIAIWSIFGLLGEAIFASAANPRSGNAVGAGIGWGIGIWSIILTMIAMYVAGRVTMHFSPAATRGDAMLSAQTMFGLSIVSAMVMTVLGGAALAGGTAANTSSSHLATMLAGLGWAGFFSLLLGWLCAMWGAISEVQPSVAAHTTERTSEKVHDIRAA
jgi:hypothetical protein